MDFKTKEPAGTIIVDTPHTYLYLILGGGKALRYGIGVGREGFTWSGTERISRMKEWPDWFPPPEMIERQPYLPRMMAGGPGNPLGARALYLGHTLYRIHGTNQPSTIGQTVSSGCIRLLNTDIEDLYSRVQVGNRVVVLPGKNPEAVANRAGPPANAAPANPHGAGRIHNMGSRAAASRARAFHGEAGTVSPSGNAIKQKPRGTHRLHATVSTFSCDGYSAAACLPIASFTRGRTCRPATASNAWRAPDRPSPCRHRPVRRNRRSPRAA